MEALLNDDIKGQVLEVFDQLKEPVEVLFFGRQEGCEYCDQTLHLVEEVTALSDKLNLSIYDIDADSELAHKFNVDKTPGLVIAGVDGETTIDFGIRIAGIPAGHEFSSLIQDLILVSGRDSGLNQQTREFLAGLTEPISLQVFVTPTCPYCPRAVILAHQLAMESQMVRAEMVEAMEFPELSKRFGVGGVPQTTINNGAGNVMGAVPEDYILAEIIRLINAN